MLDLKIPQTWSSRQLGFTALCVLTAIGLAFAVQLRLHYQVPWGTSIFWGLSDWYLWGLLGLSMALSERCLRKYQLKPGVRAAIMLMAAPLVISLHVLLTILVGTVIEPMQAAFLETYWALFSKKLTLNIITYTTLALLVQLVVARTRLPTEKILAKKGEVSRLLCPGQIMMAESLGNYVKLKTRDGHWLVRSTLGNTERVLGNAFLRVSRSRLVNLAHVAGFREEPPHLILMLSDNAEIRVAKRRKTAVRRELQSHSQT